MTEKQIRDRLEQIERIGASDPEAAHGLEDTLYDCFICYVANGGKKDLVRKAKMVLTSGDLDFPRWCA